MKKCMMCEEEATTEHMLVDYCLECLKGLRDWYHDQFEKKEEKE